MLYWLRNFVRWVRMAHRAWRTQVVPEIKKINDQIDKLEASIVGTDECVVDIYGIELKLQDKQERLEGELTSVKAENEVLRSNLDTVFKKLNAITDARIEDKLDRLEEGLTSAKAEIIDLNSHLNSVIKELNAITELLNDKYGDLFEMSYESDN